MRRRTILKKSFNGAAYLRLGIGLMCTALFVLSLVHFQQKGWRESIVAFLIGLLSGYYFTSAWYAGRIRETPGCLEVSSPQ
jgi:drug/metabolite transporter (DMT)-like permease